MDTKKNSTITSFTKLIAWQQAHKLAILIYQITERFPGSEKYSLIDQMRRSVVSISSNIAEGFSRQTKKEKVQFYFIGKGSLTELQNQLLLARDIGYIKYEEFKIIAELTVIVGKLIHGLIKSMKA